MSYRRSNDRRSTYRIFVSHSWDYSDEYERFIDLIKDTSYFEFENYSVPENDPIHTTSEEQLKRELRDQIDPVSVVIILAGMYANERKWIQEEIDIAQNKDKSILGVKPWGSQRTPSNVGKNADEMVGWNGDSVSDAVSDLSP